MKRWISIVLMAVLVVSALGLLTTLLANPGGVAPFLYLVLVIYGGLAWALWRWGLRRQDQQAPADVQQDPRVREAVDFFNKVNASGHFPPAEVHRVIDRPERPVLYAGVARMVELKASTARAQAGTRLMMGGVPLYLGRSAPVRKNDVLQSEEGELAATTRGLVFVSNDATTDVSWSRLSSVETGLDSFTVSIQGRSKPTTFLVGNGLLWAALVRNLAAMELTSRALPQGENLQPR